MTDYFWIFNINSYGGGGQNGFPIPDFGYLNKGNIKGSSHNNNYSPYGKIDQENNGGFLSNFIFNSIDTLTNKFGWYYSFVFFV